MLTPSQIQIVKSTVPVLMEHGEAITRQFYAFLFEENPQLKDIFNMGNQAKGEQPRALAQSVIAYGANIDQLQNLGPTVMRIAHKHASLDVMAEHYPIVGSTLLKAIATVLGDAVTPEIADAWGAAYNQLAEIMIGVEGDMYAKEASTPGGWNRFKPFRVLAKTQESSVVTSFTLAPEDGQPLPPHQAGQYLTVRFESIPGQSNVQMRQYTISCAPNPSHYRISVKREGGGVVSAHLHDSVMVGDQVLVHMPHGDFVLNEDSTGPVALISGGVGVTPMMAMLERLVETSSERNIVFVHSALDSSVHAFANRLDEICQLHPNVSSVVYYEDRTASDEGVIEGRVSLESLSEHVSPSADAYFCGPRGFMESVNAILAEIGVPEERRHHEVFGPTTALRLPEVESV